MRTALLLAFLALTSPAALASEGHGDEEPADDHAEEGVSSPELQPGQSFNYTFTEAMTFDYHCHPHPWMLAAIEALPSNGSAPVTHVINITEPANEDFEAWTFDPKTYQVRVGDTVTWVNNGTVMHRITQTVGEHIAHVGTLGGEDDHVENADTHADDGHAHAAAPSSLWWLAVAGVGAFAVSLWVRGNKKAP